MILVQYIKNYSSQLLYEHLIGMEPEKIKYQIHDKYKLFLTNKKICHLFSAYEFCQIKIHLMTSNFHYNYSRTSKPQLKSLMCLTQKAIYFNGYQHPGKTRKTVTKIIFFERICIKIYV